MASTTPPNISVSEQNELLKKENEALKLEVQLLKKKLKQKLFITLHGEAKEIEDPNKPTTNILLKPVHHPNQQNNEKIIEISTSQQTTTTTTISDNKILPPPIPPRPPAASTKKLLKRTPSLLKQYKCDKVEYAPDSPIWRSELKEMEIITQTRLKRIEKIGQRFKEYITYGKNYVVITKRLARELFVQSENNNKKSTSEYHQNDNNVIIEELLNEAFQHFANIINEVGDSMTVLLESLDDAFVAKTNEFIKSERNLTASYKKNYSHASHEYDSLLKSSLSPKTKDFKIKDVTVIECFKKMEIARFDYVHHLNNGKEYQLVAATLASWFSYLAYFKQCQDIFVGMDGIMKSMSNRVSAQTNDVMFYETIWKKRRLKLTKLLDIEETRYNIFADSENSIDMNDNKDLYSNSNNNNKHHNDGDNDDDENGENKYGTLGSVLQEVSINYIPLNLMKRGHSF